MEETKIIETLIGKTFYKVYKYAPEQKTYRENDELRFEGKEGSFKFYHRQDCCEDVNIDDIIGDLDDLIGSPITKAEERTMSKDYRGDYNSWSKGDWPEEAKTEYNGMSATWTFYEFATVKGSVTVRWVGQSNGHYSESVHFSEMEAA